MSDLISRQAVLDALKEYEVVESDNFTKTDIITMMTIGTIANCIEAIVDLPSAEPERRWIPVTEALPEEENKSYWICTDTGYQCKCRWTNNIYGIYESNEWGWSIFDIPQYTKVVAWMPLPEPWRGE